MTEFETKQARLHALLAEYRLDALLLRRVSSFAWATCGGASHINTADSHGIASLLVTPTACYLITNNIEAARLEREEKLGEQQWELQFTSWHESRNVIAELTRGLRVGADDPFPGATDLSGELARIRATLTPEEGDRFRTLGRLCAEAMDCAIRAVRPGQTEHQIAGLLANEAESRGVQVIVNLVGTDQRIFSYRHPLPTTKKLENYALLILCGRKGGLVCSITRAVHFGHLPDDLRRKANVVAHIDATLINATRPGRSLGEVFQKATLAYARGGFPDEWQLHHQGGLAGYEPREIVATPNAAERVCAGQAYAWNPSITGTKSEDTILVDGESSELLTAIPDWPTVKASVDGQEMERPAILEIA